MTKTLGKYLLYGLLLVLTVFCFGRFREAYQEPGSYGDRYEQAASVDATTGNTAAIPGPEGAGGAGLGSQRDEEGARSVGEEEPSGTGSVTNQVIGTGQVHSEAGAIAGTGTASGRRSSSALYLSGFVACLLGMAVLLGWDITNWAAARAARGLGADLDTTGSKLPEYEAAEEEWAKGNHLEAIQMLREFVTRHPTEQYAAIRIAEIYEKDLRNYLAAALELEEVLTRRLPEEKWGWTAIHLANVYSGKLNQPEKALATLERIVTEHPRTAAARKARQRLGLPEPDMAGVAGVAGVAGSEVGTEGELPGEEPSNLPPGFRFKKR